ncbi:unnamed protein product [Larinioides sclopetarius]|uniref:Uncharacterized protein n=1 Tax=Larinioides sclopetarius TaxID=280406 RepID=A0AAV2B5R9_9ARAC
MCRHLLSDWIQRSTSTSL